MVHVDLGTKRTQKLLPTTLKSSLKNATHASHNFHDIDTWCHAPTKETAPWRIMDGVGPYEGLLLTTSDA